MVMIILATCGDDNVKLQAVVMAVLMTYITYTLLMAVRAAGRGRLAALPLSLSTQLFAAC